VWVLFREHLGSRRLVGLVMINALVSTNGVVPGWLAIRKQPELATLDKRDFGRFIGFIAMRPVLTKSTRLRYIIGL